MSVTAYEWLQRVNRYMLIVPNYGFCFLRVQKCGQTTVGRRLLMEESGEEIMAHDTDPHGFEHYVFGSVSGHFKTHAIVRNPWDRFVANWKHMLAKGKSVSEDLTEFVRSGWWRNAEYTDWMQFRPCSYYTHMRGEKMVDHVYPFEDFEASAREILGHIDFEPDKVPVTNKTVHRHYTTYYNDETIEAVANEYREDIENFGYQFGED